MPELFTTYPELAAVSLPTWVDLASVIVGSAGGVAVARSRHLDAVGFVGLALLCGLGGGLIRDVMMQVGSVYMLDSPFAIPASAATALVAFLFQGKNFSPADVSETARAVVGYSVGLIGLITLKIAAPAFYARKDIRTPVRIAFLSLVVVQLLNLATVPLFDQAGLALSVGLGSCVNAGSLLLILGRRGIYRPRAGWGKFLLQVAAGSLVMAAGLWFAQRGVSWTALAWPVRAAGTLGLVAGAAVVYFLVMTLFGWRLRDLRPAPEAKD